MKHYFERVWVILCGWGIVLGEWGWVGISGGRWGWVHCLIMPFKVGVGALFDNAL